MLALVPIDYSTMFLGLYTHLGLSGTTPVAFPPGEQDR